MFPFGKLNSRIIWVGANEHVLRSAAKKDWGVLTLNSARCSFKAPEFLPFLCKVYCILHSYKVSWATSVFQPNRSQPAVWKSWCWEPSHCRMCILWAYITASQPGLRTPCVLLEQVPDCISCRRNQIEHCESILQRKATVVNGDEEGIQLKNTLLIKMKTFLHIAFATSNHAAQTDCSTSTKLPGQAENISLCLIFPTLEMKCYIYKHVDVPHSIHSQGPSQSMGTSLLWGLVEKHFKPSIQWVS